MPASATNHTASTTSLADPISHSFLSGDSPSIIQEQTTLDPIKIEPENMTNQGSRQFEQQIGRETQQQQQNMARPGPPRINVFEQFEQTDQKTLQSALAADDAGLTLAELLMPRDMGIQRPCTPPQQFNSCQFPLTPDTSPFTVNDISHAMSRSKTFDSTPIKCALQPGSINNPTISPEAMRRTSSYPNSKTSLEADLFQMLNVKSSPTASAGMVPNPSNFFSDLDFGAKAVDGYDSSHYSPMTDALTPLMSSFESSPEMPNMTLFDNMRGLPDLSLPGRMTDPSSSRNSHLSAYPSPPKGKSHRRTKSVVTVDEIDGTNEETGVTEDEISTYMVGPLEENKYLCTYAGCNKVCGRKENIRSHIQTHLGDRQWRCNHCEKTFVRQHDLKRHSKTHTGQKPHQCPCGSGFARQDALTRHRQRNTCVGGFGVAEGIPQSPSKRGRPKKRPDMETRRDKAMKTRERALEKASASSVSGSSEFSAPSPEMFFEDLSTATANLDKMVTIQSVESDEVLEAVNAMTPEMVEEFFTNMSKDSSPFSEFEAQNLFGVDSSAFEMESTYDSTSQWML
ncbi:MAG: hypothetical protein Q9208_001699 [Pyrenodesmia sp. 3 TL-2023]